MHLEATLQRCGTATQRRECEHTVNKVVSMQGEVIKMLLSHAFFLGHIPEMSTVRRRRTDKDPGTHSI